MTVRRSSIGSWNSVPLIAFLAWTATVAITAGDATQPIKPLKLAPRTTTPSTQAAVVFQMNEVVYPLPGTPIFREVAGGDLDGDGQTDFVGGVDGGIFWWRNLGGGVLASGQAIALVPGRSPIQIDVIDPDGDGDLDVLVTFLSPSMIAWYENSDGAGQFGDEHIVQPFVNYPRKSDSGDLDGDADPDLAIATLNVDSVRWHENDGLGGFGDPQAVAGGQPAAEVVLADLDGDLDLDAVSILDFALVWNENTDGMGAFGPPHVISVEIGGGTAVAAGDVDGDGDIDVFSGSTFSQTLCWHENLDGLGWFGPAQPVASAGYTVATLVTVDLDGDGDLDLVIPKTVSADSDEIRWYENTDGAGTFADQVILASDLPVLSSIDVVDLDGDQHFDLLLASDDGFAWLENLGDDCNGNGIADPQDILSATSDDCNLNGVPDECELNTGAATDCNASGVLDICELVTDCDSDGVLDECSPDCNANTTPDACDVFAGTSLDCNANGIPDECEPDCNANTVPDACDITAETSDDCAGNGIPDECEPDCNGNGRTDACDIEASSSQDCTGNGIPDECEADCDIDGIADSCEVSPEFTELTIESFRVGEAAVADLDGDGDQDLIRSSFQDDVLAWYENLDGQGTLGAGQVIVEDIYIQNIQAADFDLDGDVDLAVADSLLVSNVSWFENSDGAGNFGPQQPIGLSHKGGLLTFDVDSDGDLDLLVGAEAGILWHENLGAPGAFGVAQLLIARPLGAYPSALVDIDGDQLLDLLVHQKWNINSALQYHRFYWFRNLGTSFDSGQLVYPNVDVHTTVDVDLDGNLDLFVFTTGDSLLRYEYDPGTGTLEFVQYLAQDLPAYSHVLGIDIDRDGDGDILSNYSSTFGGWRWFEYLGDDLFAARHFATSGPQPPPRLIADLNGDGNEDFINFSSLPGMPQLFSWSRNERNDCDGNGVPDHCDPDCDANGLPDACEPDCNGNETADICDILGDVSDDCSANGIPDECEPDCNGNDTADECDIGSGTSLDCQPNGIPDECEPDCNGNGIADACDIASGNGTDCNLNGTLDECDLASGTSQDQNENAVPDECDSDCNANAVPDDIDILLGTSNDADGSGVPDECETDCNANGVLDDLDLAFGESVDCDGNDVPDECDTELLWVKRPVLSHLSNETPRDLGTGDVDADGDLDAFCRTEYEVLWTENLDGGGIFGVYDFVTDGNTEYESLTIEDINGDRRDDAITSGFLGGVYVFESLGNGQFSLSQLAGTWPVDAADLDGDGDNDILAGIFSPAAPDIGWFENLDGAGTFAAGTPIAEIGSVSTFVAAADLDRDGDLDIVYDGDRRLAWVESLGSGSFGATTFIEKDERYFDMEVADLDDDNDLDVAVIRDPDRSLVWFENLDGQGSFGAEQSVSNAEQLRKLDAADLDGDGDTDLLATTFGDTALLWYENLQSSLAPAATIDSLYDPQDILGVDLDRDGDMDIMASGGGTLVWYENTGNDCNANAVPDVCEPDCDGNGIADACELRSFAHLDCNGNLVPDICELESFAVDSDGDGCFDEVDSTPGDPTACGDGDGDGCEDCTSGSHDPLQDGADSDADGICDLGDCLPADDTLWGDPSEITTLVLSKPGSTTKLAWLPPVSPGADNISYDALRSPDSSDFNLPDVCLETDEPDRTMVDGESPASGAVFYYLIRVENACPGGTGNMGSDSAGVPRSGTLCSE